MSSQARDAAVADAIVAELNGATWPYAFEAMRAYSIELDRSDTRTMYVMVQHTGSTGTQVTRRHRRETHGIAISFRMNVEPTNTEAVDALGAFVESVADFFRGIRGRRKIEGTQAHVATAEVTPVNPDELQSNRQFFAGVSLAVEEVVFGVSP